MPDPVLIDVVSCRPPHRVRQNDVRAHASRHFAGHLDQLRRLLAVFDNAGIERRSFAMPLSWFDRSRDFAAKNRQFVASATELSARAVERLLVRTGVVADRIDHLLFVTSTGLATPTIDARLANLLPLRPDIRRVPLWGLGCAGGALGLVHAAELLRGAPGDLAVLVTCELCTLTFCFDDFSKSNLVATALFADGVTASLLGGAECGLGGARIVATHTRLWPDTLDVMGWSFESQGMQVVFSRRIPAMVEQHMGACLHDFLAAHALELGEIHHLLVHPGGSRVLRAYQDALGVDGGRLARSQRILREHGNCSSSTVMLVLEDLLAGGGALPGQLGLLTALGPGFNAGSLLLRF